MSDEADLTFLAAFEACTIPKAEWTHRAHLRMAWLYLGRLEFEDGLSRIRDGIRKYNQAVGGPANGYHETVTVVYARLVRHCLSQPDSRALGFEAFLATYPWLLDRKSPPSLRHYKEETLKSDEARARFVEPDLEALP